MALAGGDSFFCEVYMGRGTVSLNVCRWPAESMCDGYTVLHSTELKFLKYVY